MPSAANAVAAPETKNAPAPNISEIQRSAGRRADGTATRPAATSAKPARCSDERREREPESPRREHQCVGVAGADEQRPRRPQHDRDHDRGDRRAARAASCATARRDRPWRPTLAGEARDDSSVLLQLHRALQHVFVVDDARSGPPRCPARARPRGRRSLRLPSIATTSSRAAPPARRHRARPPPRRRGSRRGPRSCGCRRSTRASARDGTGRSRRRRTRARTALPAIALGIEWLGGACSPDQTWNGASGSASPGPSIQRSV